MKVSLHHLRAFVAVSRERSFTRAAELLDMSQPAVTTAIKQLEETLNVRLFDRSTKVLRLTKASETFLPSIERVLGELDQTLHDFQAMVDGAQGHVAVSVLPSVATNVLPRTIESFFAAFPNIRLSLRDDNSSGVRERVLSGEVDLGVAGRPDPTEALDFEPLIRDPFGVVAHKSHPLSQGSGPLKWQELADYPYISFAADTGIRPILDTLKDVPENISAPWIEVSNIATVLSLLKTNLGIAALPQMSVNPIEQDVVFRTLLNPPLFRELGLITRRNRSLSPAAERFTQHMKDALKPYWER
ncbi:LysR family transcriptional regulator [Cohaesibacter gelatinilyticus]|uniref:DNA-binding transcriptional regulator, LysR family n=1 Tax=Cohaesibacter gelatinilyticus TaxID=372072 RepID=A0A285PHZ7_9HYPH|nr:LysR family transcriptional regulator [Cohaesibacter gelatinilyticus]SNZ21048.1 DNA-binding transcriptional regulator, LysR family [Cohaesibacter gelatinilyticus]